MARPLHPRSPESSPGVRGRNGTVQVIGTGSGEAVRQTAREFIAAWLTDEEVAVELISRYPWARASAVWVGAERRRLIGGGFAAPANGDLHRLMNLS